MRRVWEWSKGKKSVSRARNPLSFSLSNFAQSSSYFSYARVCVCVLSFFYATLVPLECELLHATRYLIIAISIALFFTISHFCGFFFFAIWLAVVRSDKFYFGYSFGLRSFFLFYFILFYFLLSYFLFFILFHFRYHISLCVCVCMCV